jgi:urease accessory protein
LVTIGESAETSSGTEVVPAQPAEGRLQLVFRARQGRTYLASHAVRNPLKVVRPFGLSDGGALVQVLLNAPGMFANDHYSVEIDVERGARALVVSPSATKIHHMPDGGCATQSVHIRVECGACLQYIPALNIPFPEAEFRQRVSINLAPGSRFGIVEAWAMGRVERGEHLQFRRLSSTTRVDIEGQPAYRDALDLAASTARPAGWGLLEGHRYVVSGYWHGPEIQAPDAFSGKNLRSLAVFGSFDPSSHYFRGLFSDSLAMQRAIAEVEQAVAESWNLPAIQLQPYRC